MRPTGDSNSSTSVTWSVPVAACNSTQRLTASRSPPFCWLPAPAAAEMQIDVAHVAESQQKLVMVAARPGWRALNHIGIANDGDQRMLRGRCGWQVKLHFLANRKPHGIFVASSRDYPPCSRRAWIVLRATTLNVSVLLKSREGAAGLVYWPQEFNTSRAYSRRHRRVKAFSVQLIIAVRPAATGLTAWRIGIHWLTTDTRDAYAKKCGTER